MVWAAFGLIPFLNPVGIQQRTEVSMIPWALEGITFARSLGLLEGYPDDGDYRGRGKSRFELAVIYHALGSHLRSRESYLREISERVSLDLPGTAAAIRDAAEEKELLAFFHKQGLERAIGFVQKANGEFAYELTALGVPNDLSRDLARVRLVMNRIRLTRPGGALEQFSDVPINHWAAKATLDLRSQGLIHGDPGGSFRG